MAAPNYFTSKYGTRINVTGLTGKPLQRVRTLANNRYGTRAQQVANRAMRIPKKTPPTTQAPTTQAPTTTTPVVDSSNIANAAPPANPQQPTPGTAETLFPSTRMFEPQNYQGSPLYQFQVKAGQDQLAKSLAAKGLTNSGAAIRKELDIPMMAAAQDTDRMTRIASENADRLKSFQDAEALRLERAGNNQWQRAFDIATLMSNQSPWQGALAGLGATADVTSEAGKARANFLRDLYRRVSGGGGGGGTPVAIPSGPDYSNIIPGQIASDNASNNSWIQLLTRGLANIF